jgi:hypothetical protein
LPDIDMEFFQFPREKSELADMTLSQDTFQKNLGGDYQNHHQGRVCSCLPAVDWVQWKARPDRQLSKNSLKLMFFFNLNYFEIILLFSFDYNHPFCQQRNKPIVHQATKNVSPQQTNFQLKKHLKELNHLMQQISIQYIY